jgi:hypothetical protein
MGYKKEIKDAYPKKVCHMPTRHDYKKKKKRCIPKEDMPHAHKACHRKEKKDSPHPKEIKEREMVHEKEFIHHPPKKKKIYITTHLHILIKVYDLFLLDLDFDLATQAKQACLFTPILSST